MDAEDLGGPLEGSGGGLGCPTGAGAAGGFTNRVCFGVAWSGIPEGGGRGGGVVVEGVAAVGVWTQRPEPGLTW